MAPAVRVIIVYYNGGAFLQRCIDNLCVQTFSDFEAVIADNGSSDGSIDAVEPLDGRFRILRLAANLGFAAANNRAAEGAETPWLATLNPDAFAEPGWLAALMAATELHPGVSMFGSTQIDANHPDRLDGTGDAIFAAGFPWRGNHGRPISEVPPEGETFGPCAAAALFRTRDFVGAGGFDERFFCYCEDVDLAFRIWTMVKNVPWPLLMPMIPAHVAVTLYISLRMTALKRGGLAPIWRGIRDGLLGLREMLECRGRLQGARSASVGEIARALSWSPWRFRSRRHDVRPR